MKDVVTKEKLGKYFDLTSRALKICRESVSSGRDDDAKEIFEMVGNYLSDARHFEKNGEWVTAYGALNYAHGWLDAGVRLGVFDVDDDKLFTVK